ncbi:phenylalanyl-tRNA synthetase [Obba rivulosa]|uniref:Phenylalanine--tRNA ligase, mitochondrial n=1 Tax=Obba rivulosa TaxID=1052685 RepID=A0A8E2DPH8_9APHY|nr:phenylalanyl-tRNA synthetase [Obba rivulosa]
MTALLCRLPTLHLTHASFSLSRRLLSRPARPPTVSLLGEEYPTDDVTNVTSSIAEKLGRDLHRQPAHPLGIIRALIETHFAGFTAISDVSPVVTPALNFDDLGFPADHPGRALSDSYYINRGLMLRTHTSAHEVETFRAGERKWLLSADVYRRDEIDASHYPVFHQMEGARVFSNDKAGLQELTNDTARLAAELERANIEIEDIPHISSTNPVQPEHDPQTSALVAHHLKLSLNSLILKLFGGHGASTEPVRVRWIEAYFPFTSPSYEVEVFYRGKWLEILGCGVVKQSTLDRANVPNSISWAFGLGLERLAMFLFSIPDIRLFWSQDERFLSQFSPGRVTTFKPYSKYPPNSRDISFWLSASGMHDNDFCDVVRDTVGDIAESVEMIDHFIHPKTGRSSKCFRINYRSMDKSLTDEEANTLHQQVASRVREKFGVEIRD